MLFRFVLYACSIVLILQISGFYLFLPICTQIIFNFYTIRIHYGTRPAPIFVFLFVRFTCPVLSKLSYLIQAILFYCFLEVDWDNLEQLKPPSRPSAKDIYTLNESKLGLFVDEKVSRQILLTEDDHKLYENWDFISHTSFEEEIVDLLIQQEITVIKSNLQILYLLVLFVIFFPI